MICPKAKVFIDFHGSVIAKHVSDRQFDINKFVMHLRQKQIPWKDIYWKLNSRLLHFNCSECDL
jgi:hypothetical protein